MSRYTLSLMQIVFIAIILVLFSCSDNNSLEKEDIVLTINDFNMSRTEFQTQYKADMEYNETFKKSDTVKQEMLDGLIRKELLIQEAKKMGLDKNIKFVTAIERYWEATLIKLLMEQKTDEILKTTLVSDVEVKKKYDAYKLKNTNLPALNTIKKEIVEEIIKSKKAYVLENWVESLRKNANIKIDDKIFIE